MMNCATLENSGEATLFVPGTRRALEVDGFKP